MNFFEDKKIIVTGGGGFLGGFVVEKLKEKSCKKIFIPRHKDFELTKLEDIKRMYESDQFDIVIHLAAAVGGIGANQKNPGKFFYDNLIMGTQLMEYARQYQISKFVAVGTICSYPKFTPIPFLEENIWDGYPEETNAPYGLAKKMMLVQSQAYRQQYDFNSIFLLPVNLYGPRDNFNEETSHVIPALIRKCIYAISHNLDYIEVWGDGSASREFLYVEDAADAILLATEHFDKSAPVNIGAGFEIKIKDLTELIVKLTGFTGKIIWQTQKPNGQPRRRLDTTKANQLFGFTAHTDFEAGLIKTIDWYTKERK